MIFGKHIERQPCHVGDTELENEEHIFELPYWRTHLQHNVDVTHVEKIVFDILLGTLLDIK